MPRAISDKANLMPPKHYHTPAVIDSPRKRCPVCHQASYSRSGIHPQCAMQQAEPPRSSTKKKSATPDTPIAVVSPAADTGEIDPTSRGTTGTF
jgi:hypothetical protein